MTRSVKPGEFPHPSKQGQGATCTRHALAKCIVAEAERKSIDFNQEAAISSILNLKIDEETGKNIDPEYVESYNNQDILLMDYSTGRYYDVNIRVLECSVKKYNSSIGQYVLTYESDAGYHAIYVKEKDVSTNGYLMEI